MGCSVCAHRERLAIEAEASAEGANVRTVAVRYGLTKAGLAKHIAAHPRAAASSADAPPPAKRRRATSPAKPKAFSTRNALVTLAPVPSAPPSSSALPAAEEQASFDDDAPITSRSPRAMTARGELDIIRGEIARLLEEVHSAKDVPFTDKTSAIRTALTAIRLMSKLTGEDGGSDATIAASPFYRRVRAAIVDALRPKEHRAALEAVVAALEQLEGGQADRSEAAE